ncbi:Magnesium and cobalt efflux protein CorC [Serinicoccus hydrothermalis]|uniref:Magnesium and cobalt efflux protein CorC n=1 Tax=Serinicoccus hydrothermalis TaxID=1758689 RepID=A0A1B1NAS3_9MICO|nr:hemolysin family protein [Serinicoccus hydrothermalis]ANS78533.1 Magnesium and cobalt efflux protein CorC [Serinicoccus hydrothermalis]
MDTALLTNIALVLLFVLIGGVFAATEMAIVSLRPSQVDDIERSGERGARIAALVRDPNTFLSAVQVGVTVAGFFSSAFGGATISPSVSAWLQRLGVPGSVADPLALVAMTLVIAYLSLVLGELTPKRLAMQRSAGFTRVLAPPLGVFATLLRPVIWFLSVSTNLMVRVLGGDPSATSEQMTIEELRRTVEDNRDLRPYSRQILADVFRAGERTLGDVLRPRPDVEFLVADATIAQVIGPIRESGHSRYPVTGDGVDDVLGFVHIRDLLTLPEAERETRRVREVLRDITALPVTKPVLATLALLRAEQQHLALVVDEHGGTEGIVTIEDLVEEVVGEIYDEYDTDPDPEDSLVRAGGRAVVSGSLIVEELEDALGLALPHGSYETVAGLVLALLGRVAEEGDTVEVDDLRLTVVGLDGLRITEVEVSREPSPAEGEGAEPG